MTRVTFDDLLVDASPVVRELAVRAAELIRGVVPDAAEEVDGPAKLLGFTYLPGTYKHLIVAVALHAAHVNIMFARGAELVEIDGSGLLEGTGKRARHIKVREAQTLSNPGVRALLEAAAARTPQP